MSEKMHFKTVMKRQLDKLLSWLVGLYFLLFFMRVFEWIYLQVSSGMPDPFSNEMKGFIYDCIELAPLILIVSLISWSFSLIKNWMGLTIFLLVVTSFMLFQLALVIYFEEATLPLDYGSIASMSGAQVKLILSIYGFSNWQLIFIVPIAFVFIGLWKLGTLFGKFKFFKVLTLIILVIGTAVYFISSNARFNSEDAEHMQRNKVILFAESYFDYHQKLNELLDADMQEVLERYYAYHPEKDATDFYNYPFFSTERTENHLGDYFQKIDTAPNIVFIIGESLGRIYSGENAKLGSFTPFLDSLANEGLYWQNGLSNAERTFGAIPNLMAGVPEGRVGFLNLQSSMPDHLSIPLLLKEKNGYETSFYCGADSTFDNMADYLMFQKFDHIYGINSFTKNQNMSMIVDDDGEEKEFNWGAEDLIVFEESMDLMNMDSIVAPFFNLYLTTSFHKPYTHKDIEYFENLAVERIKSLKPKGYKSFFKKKDAFGALMYMDYSIQQCFNAYQKREDFDNTIFVIVGDHSLRMLTDDSRLEKYQVPILIYSPLMRKSGSFENVVCHKDVPSALQALLRDNFNLDMPNFNISQSNNLKAEPNFNSSGDHVFMYSGKAMENYLWKDYLLYEDELFRINNKMKLIPVDNEALLDSMKTRLSDYRILSNYVGRHNKYIKQKFYDNYVHHKTFLEVNDNFDGPHAMDKTYPFLHYVTTKRAASSPRSLSNKSSHYFGLIENLDISSENRVRLKIKFMLSITDEYPTLYVSTLADSNTVLFQKSIAMNNTDCQIRSTNNPDWISVETAIWIKAKSGKQILNLYFHQPDKQEFFIDNLKIQVKEF